MSEIQPPSFSHPHISLALWWITAALIALNVALFLWQIATGVDSSQPNIQDSLAWGADYPPLTWLGQPLRLLSSIFFHFGFIHLALNMWALYIFGHIAEQLYGRFYFMVLYIFSGLAGSLLSAYLSMQDSYEFLKTENFALLPHLSAGASGAVMGLGAALTVLAFFPPLPNQAYILVKRTLLMVLGLNLAIGTFMPNINNAAHIGGMLMGAILSGVWMLLQRQNRPKLAPMFGTLLACAITWASYRYCQHFAVGLEPLWQALVEHLN
ncbi:rhomboid family intramembrane serine protease [Acinetobacter sp. MD2(2019)]|uniref:rhomboid family intramembrane serine protease n=1 Tax=Acinetobacter sp. MD2(2019) TaxID=2605273 RepID=UPI002D1ED47E|nr:rhomboid family intramembrane serine protease [Acinetobacter sp. MD2(2019)]MEB3754041.1 rhomboid family intramembrane serine protease [Acinetobacter sp. MD2(2019)]